MNMKVKLKVANCIFFFFKKKEKVLLFYRVEFEESLTSPRGGGDVSQADL